MVEPPMLTCRICLEETADRSTLIAPCRCAGSAKYVHRECLDHWRGQNVGTDRAQRCEVCHFPYTFDSEPKADNAIQALDRVMKLEYLKLGGLSLGVVALATGLVTLLDRALGGKIKARFQYGPFSYVIAAIILILFCTIAVTFFGAYRASPRETGSMVLFFLFCGHYTLTGPLLGLGIIAAGLKQYLDQRQAYHRDLIWKEGPRLAQVHDYGEAGPVRA